MLEKLISTDVSNIKLPPILPDICIAEQGPAAVLRCCSLLGGVTK